jgi:HD domain-containing protein
VIVTDFALIDEILGPHREALGERTFTGYRNHALRMVNFGRYLTDDEPGRDDKLAIMAAFHDLPFFLDGDLDYLGRACEWTRDHLKATGQADWEPEIRLMIENHHKVRRYRGPSPALVEAMRKADWIDVSFTGLRFGIPRSFVREVSAALPINDAYTGVALPMIGRYAIRHLRRPLPMMRW